MLAKKAPDIGAKMRIEQMKNLPEDYNYQHDKHHVDEDVWVVLAQAWPTWKRDLAATAAALVIAALVIAGYNQLVWGSLCGPRGL